MAETIKVLGLPELRQYLASIPPLLATKVLKKGVAAGARVVKVAAQKQIGTDPKTRTGTLKRAAIVKFIRAESNATQVEYIMTFRKGKREQKKGRDAFYASFVEFGHGGKRAPPHRFLRPAFDANYHQALAVMLSKMRDELLKIPGFVP